MSTSSPWPSGSPNATSSSRLRSSSASRPRRAFDDLHQPPGRRQRPAEAPHAAVVVKSAVLAGALDELVQEEAVATAALGHLRHGRGVHRPLQDGGEQLPHGLLGRARRRRCARPDRPSTGRRSGPGRDRRPSASPAPWRRRSPPPGGPAWPRHRRAGGRRRRTARAGGPRLVGPTPPSTGAADRPGRRRRRDPDGPPAPEAPGRRTAAGPPSASPSPAPWPAPRPRPSGGTRTRGASCPHRTAPPGRPRAAPGRAAGRAMSAAPPPDRQVATQPRRSVSRHRPRRTRRVVGGRLDARRPRLALATRF